MAVDVDNFTYFDITEGDLRIHNPLSVDGLRLVVEYLGFENGDRVLDVGCGNGALVNDLASRWHIQATGVDLNPHFIARAKRRSQRVQWLLADARDYWAEPNSVGKGICLGATFALGGFDETVAYFANALRVGGRVAIGELFTDPDVGTNVGTHATEESRTLPELVAACQEFDFQLVGLVVASTHDWDHYRSSAVQGFKRWARAHQKDPRVDVIGERVARMWRTYITEDRRRFRWAVLVLERV